MSIERALRKIAKEKKEKTRKLNLSWERLTEIPKEILELNHLKSLNLGNNQISDIHFLEQLINLQSLELSYNKILDISYLKKLTKLQFLDLRDNQISNIHSLEKLTYLQDLYLSYNQISNVGSLENLTKLQTLDLRDNRIINIDPLKYLLELAALDLSFNQVSDIQSLLPLIKSEKIAASLKDTFWTQNGALNLYNNPLTNPPIETIAKGNKAILKYFEDIAQQGKDYLYEAKLLIIGDGGAGKTSLAWKMKDLQAAMPEKGNDRTKGIDIQALPIRNLKDETKPFRMNVWDFGGQGYYHSTHQFFLTKRSLYVIVNNTRINKTDFNDWLQTVSLFSENSPVIIVENEVGGAKSEFDLRGLQQHFDNILYVRVADVSNITDGRLEKLIDDIGIDIQRLPHVGSELPKLWVKIREDLAVVAKSEAFISDKAFYKICKKYKITERDAIKRLGDLFHDLGIFLHFRTDEVLRRTVILQNTWATKGVYVILDSDLVRRQKGYFTIEQAETIWENTDFEDMHHELVRLMAKFELCYRIPYASPAAYISPNLLPTEKRDYEWNEDQNLIIYYRYEFMPKGLLGRLIVRLHRHVKDIQKMAWRNGCVFAYEGTTAQVVETYGNKKLEIRVQGKHCVRLSSIIIREIDELNEGFKRIKVKKLFPCNCKTCQQSATPHFYTYENLMNRKAKGKRTVECDQSFEDVLVHQILEGVYNATAAKEATIKELLGKGKIREAIDVFEENYPHEGTLLLSKYSEGERVFYLGLMNRENWRIFRQQIADSLLKLSKRTPKRQPVSDNLTPDLKKIGEQLNSIEQQLSNQDLLLNRIIEKSATDQQELVALLVKIDQGQQQISDDFAADIIAIVQKGMADFESNVPQAKELIADWQAVSQQLNLSTDSKAKLKLTIPFLFIKFEKELTWNGKDWFKAIREDIKRGIKGNWSEMFVQ